VCLCSIPFGGVHGRLCMCIALFGALALFGYLAGAFFKAAGLHRICLRSVYSFYINELSLHHGRML
jgi:hypothetical protein